MPFALPLLLLFDLIAAALTFAIVASIPLWRHAAIPAPVFVFVAAPMTSLFVMASFMPTGLNARSEFPLRLILAALAIASLLAAYVGWLACGFIFRTVAPRIERSLGLRRWLLLQLAILLGGTLSLVVLLFSASNIAVQIWHWGPHWCVPAVAITGGLGVLACVLALSRLHKPNQYCPKPPPDFIGRRIYSRSD
jgi:hypothetical protein